MSNIKKYDYLDILRIISCISVILIHTSCTGFYASTTIKDFTISNFYDSISRFCVPMFFMISGALFLNSNKKIEIKSFFKNKTLKIFFDFIIWSLIYFAFDTILINHGKITIGGLISSITNFKFHLWFLKVMIYIYLFIPLIKLISDQKDQKLLKYLLFIFLIFGILLYNISYLPIPQSIINLSNSFRIYSDFWYIGYFILGYYLFITEFSKKKRIIIYILGIVSFVTCFGIQNILYIINGNKTEILYGYFSITTFFTSVALFVFIKQKFKNKDYKEINLRSIWSKTYGIYLIHIMVMDVFSKLGFDIFSFNYIISIPILTISVFIASYIIISIIKKIPILRKIV